MLVVVSTTAEALILPITRGTVALADADKELPPGVVPYPVDTRYFPSTDLVSNPSLVAVPLAINGLFEPLVEVGKATD